MDAIKEAMIREEDTGERNPALDPYREGQPGDDLELMRANVASLRANPTVPTLRVSREHYLLMADEIERLVEVERRLDEILNLRAIAI